VVHLAGPRALSRLEFGQLVLDALGLPRSLATPGLSTAAAVRRPRELVLAARLTPRAFTKPLRAPETALSAVGTA
jgi:dTDP-4-dehydrorhamnose reductase